MTLTVELPDDLATHSDPAREALQALVIEGFRSEALSSPEAARMLGMGRIEFQDFLIERGVTEHLYGVEAFLEDLQTTERVSS